MKTYFMNDFYSFLRLLLAVFCLLLLLPLYKKGGFFQDAALAGAMVSIVYAYVKDFRLFGTALKTWFNNNVKRVD